MDNIFQPDDIKLDVICSGCDSVCSRQYTSLGGWRKIKFIKTYVILSVFVVSGGGEIREN